MKSLLWHELVTTALVGTQRQAVKLTSADNQLAEVLSRLDKNDKEGSLLSAAGAIALYQKAGKLTLADDRQLLPESCEPEELPVCSLSAGQYLAQILNGERANLLPEWLSVATVAKKLAPPRYLSELLTVAQKQRNLRTAILPVLGKRGLWLAAQNPDWNYLLSENAVISCQNDNFKAIKLLLAKYREKDPNEALEQLKATWKKESAEERASLLQALEINLNINDEPFLEAALDDRRKQVRNIAAKLLVKLPKSRLVQRMIARVRPLLQLNGNRVQVTLPQKCSQDMTRDGIDESVYSAALGEKAGWLLQMVSYVPPSLWCDTWGKTPKQIVQAIDGSEWEKLLLEGWAIASTTSQDIAWAEVLLAVSGKFGHGYLLKVEQQIENLLKVLPSDRALAVILQTLLQYQNKLLNSQHPALAMLTVSPYPWTEEISKVVLSSIRRVLEQNQQQNDWSLRSLFGDFARYMDPSVVYQADVDLRSVLKPESYGREFVEEFLATLLFRFDMREALKR
ncbi:MAG: DUF5691 domain-containing protein [Heteroscytonema crispum UTEX LB 1556]